MPVLLDDKGGILSSIGMAGPRGQRGPSSTVRRPDGLVEWVGCSWGYLGAMTAPVSCRN
eukprot:COSAG05_NODE_562_length_8653_cov_189.762333_6_plen_59_part_00